MIIIFGMASRAGKYHWEVLGARWRLLSGYEIISLKLHSIHSILLVTCDMCHVICSITKKCMFFFCSFSFDGWAVSYILGRREDGIRTMPLFVPSCAEFRLVVSLTISVSFYCQRLSSN